MGHVQFILEARKKAQTATPSAPTTTGDFDLPGFHRTEKMRSDLLVTRKVEYNFTLKQISNLRKKLKSQKGKAKEKTKQHMSNIREHMATLLSGIGTYSNEEKDYGFSEVRNEF